MNESIKDEIRKKSGVQFNKEVVEAFFRIANMKGR
jgi:response regulator RpfG family c-di-GMP phosphodiesterase